MKLNIKLRDVVKITGGVVVGDADYIVESVNSIFDAGPGDITFAVNEKLAENTSAGCIIAKSEIKGKNAIVVDDPQEAFTKLLKYIDEEYRKNTQFDFAIHPSVKKGKNVKIGVMSFIGKNSTIGDNSTIYPFVYIGSDVTIGDSTVIYPNVTILDRVKIGSRCIIHSGSVIGADGFGYITKNSKHNKIPQVGGVEIGDDVEIGACVTIDRATAGKTVIGSGTKIDNLVHIAHNVKIGENCIVVAQTGIAGSARIGNCCTLAAQSGVKDHVSIEDGVIIAARTGVTKNLKKGIYAGFPVEDINTWRKKEALLKKLVNEKNKE